MKWLKSWIETIKIMRDKQLMRDIKEARKDFERGKTITFTLEYKGKMPQRPLIDVD